MAKQKAETEAAETTKHIVKEKFRDASDYTTIHEEGKDVSHFDADRLEKLVNLGLVEKK